MKSKTLTTSIVLIIILNSCNLYDFLYEDCSLLIVNNTSNVISELYISKNDEWGEKKNSDPIMSNEQLEISLTKDIYNVKIIISNDYDQIIDNVDLNDYENYTLYID